MAEHPLSFHEIKDLDMRIAANGDWFYRGSRIERKNLVRLFSTILRREEDGRYFLQTPVERGEVLVEKAPFMAVLMDAEGMLSVLHHRWTNERIRLRGARDAARARARPVPPLQDRQKWE